MCNRFYSLNEQRQAPRGSTRESTSPVKQHRALQAHMKLDEALPRVIEYVAENKQGVRVFAQQILSFL